MGLRKIILFEDNTLRKESRLVTSFDARLHQLLDDLAETMHDANGAGLAAPQVGVLRHVCVVDIGEGVTELVNPVIRLEEGEQEGPEGCLSLPGKTGWVKRPMKVSVEAQDRYGRPFTMEAEGFLARAMCHEIDHLRGRLYTDIFERFMTAEELLALEEQDGDEADE